MENFPKLVITDIDGVWTDGGMFYDKHDNELKKFNTSDSAGVLFLKILNVPTAIITGENTPIVARRAKKLNIKYTYLGIKDKVKIAEDLCQNLNINFNEVAYIGDDINDIELLKKVAISAAPANAPQYIKDIVDIKLSKNGGDGAFREFVETMLNYHDKMNFVIDTYLSNNKNDFSQ
ncbi:KdsC family phosphatase [Hyunsoonleella sp. 2307UL5-6]|uniref:KdsC family phosphatase n=1 Tax=Hyunsoonleella sp. 2307UL5-6 TaxID=3384768 RepID=UPI0039BC2D8D